MVSSALLSPSRSATLCLLALLPRRAFATAAPKPARLGPRAKQSLGQNFLTDVELARRIALAVEPAGDDGARVFELGPGQGAISHHLVERFPRMTAIEIDERMITHLHEELPALHTVHGDMLKLDFAHLREEAGGGRLSVVSNTPYYLTSPLLFKCLANVEHLQSCVLTMQREVADKVLSPPRKKTYGILSVMLQLFGGAPEVLFELPPEAFAPAPKVTSSCLRFSPTATPPGESTPLTEAQRASVLALLKMTFEMRRKMLRVSLRPLLESGAVRRPPEAFLTMRPEQLAPADWLDLARALFGDDLSGVPSMLERHQVSKAWKAHKAGYSSEPRKYRASGS